MRCSHISLVIFNLNQLVVPEVTVIIIINDIYIGSQRIR